MVRCLGMRPGGYPFAARQGEKRYETYPRTTVQYCLANLKLRRHFLIFLTALRCKLIGATRNNVTLAMPAPASSASGPSIAAKNASAGRSGRRCMGSYRARQRVAACVQPAVLPSRPVRNRGRGLDCGGVRFSCIKLTHNSTFQHGEKAKVGVPAVGRSSGISEDEEHEPRVGCLVKHG